MEFECLKDTGGEIGAPLLAAVILTVNSSSCSSGGGGNGGGGGGGNGAMGSKGISMPIDPIGISMPVGICIPMSMPTSFASSLLLLSTPSATASATALGAAVAWAKLFSSSGGGGAEGGLGIRAPTIGRGGTGLRGFRPAEDDTLPPSPHGGARGTGGLGPLSVIISRGRSAGAGICPASEHGPDVGATAGA